MTFNCEKVQCVGTTAVGVGVGAFVVEELVDAPVVVLDPEFDPEFDPPEPHAAMGVIISAAVVARKARRFT
jgi:hypothetical protein